MLRFLRRNGLLIIAGIGGLLVGAVAAGGLVLHLTGMNANTTAAASPTPVPTPSHQVVGDVMDTLTGDCTACHASPQGGVGTKDIPPVGHPLEGWTQCTSCHATNRLVVTAPGHTGIHAEQCQVCHTAASIAGPMRPHGEMQRDCLSCHGSTAPLPDSMKNRSASTCWLCHRATDQVTPAIPHPLAGNAACFTCHTEGKVGALPANHQTRMETTCTACHEVKRTTAPAAPHSLSGLEDKCESCHAPGVTPRPLPSPSLSSVRYPLVSPSWRAAAP